MPTYVSDNKALSKEFANLAKHFSVKNIPETTTT